MFLGLWASFRLAGVLRRFVARQLDRIVPQKVGVVLSIGLVGCSSGH